MNPASDRMPGRTGGPEQPDLPPGAYAAALACLPGVGPAWLVETLALHGPKHAWQGVLAGELTRPRRSRVDARSVSWADAARSTDVASLWSYCWRAKIDVTWPGAPGYPRALQGGPSPAGVLFAAGSLAVLDGRPAVAVVGTRRCTPEGAAVAYQLGYELVAAGICVVSGLALGIDGAAHAGALAALAEIGSAGDMAQPDPRAGSTVGIAASGVDVIYPRQHGALWRQVVRSGAVLSETPPRLPAQSWRFPSRNRVVAGLTQMVVVVECHARGGSWHTVDAALRCGIEVGAVPGPVHSSASVGTNTLLHEGAAPVRGARDVLDALGIFSPGPEPYRLGPDRLGPDRLGPDRLGPDRLGPDRLGPDRSEPAVLSARWSAPATPAAPGAVAPGPKRAATVVTDGRVSPRSPAGSGSTDVARALDSQVLDAVGWHSRCLEDIVERSGLPVPAVVMGLDRLEERGAVLAEAGWWWRAHGRQAPP